MRRRTATGRIAGELRLVGGGDPNLSARAIPYRMGPATGNPLAAIDDLADQVAARGVKRIAGDIVGDDTWYLWQPYAAGWGIEDPQSEDGPPISALTINDNAFTLSVRPGAREGELALVQLHPAIEFHRIDNRIRTVAAGGERRIHYDRVPGSFDLRLWGTIPLRDRGQSLVMAMEDPALYAAVALRDALPSARHRGGWRGRGAAPVSQRSGGCFAGGRRSDASGRGTGAARIGAADRGSSHHR